MCQGRLESRLEQLTSLSLRLRFSESDSVSLSHWLLTEADCHSVSLSDSELFKLLQPSVALAVAVSDTDSDTDSDSHCISDQVQLRTEA